MSSSKSARLTSCMNNVLHVLRLQVRIRMFDRSSYGGQADKSVPMLVFTITEIGTKITLRKWDQEVQVCTGRYSATSPCSLVTSLSLPLFVRPTSTGCVSQHPDSKTMARVVDLSGC